MVPESKTKIFLDKPIVIKKEVLQSSERAMQNAMARNLKSPAGKKLRGQSGKLGSGRQQTKTPIVLSSKPGATPAYRGSAQW